ncbi:MAG: hypothetical protein M1457_03460 [bacterium]|nr:hypothetical protein [bacterium]
MRGLGILLLAAVALGGTGCGYLKARGRDAKNMIDLGISVNNTWKPQFGLYFDFFNMTPIGFGSLDCKVLGMGNRQIGWMDYENHSWGALAVGREKHGHGLFNAQDPEQARPDQRGLSERPAFDVGFVGAFTGEDNPPKLQYIECNRCIHLGWIGIQNTMRPLGILDFILGWTTFDLLGDDDLPEPQKP